MKQLLQNLRSGEAGVVELPAPGGSPGRVLVRTMASLVSAGTERMIVDFAEKNILQKARARPDLVRQTVEKAQREGILTTLDAVRNRLDQPMSLGYSSAGIVIESGVPELEPGARVACAGAGFAAHAEIVSVPKNLAVRLPDGVSFEAAAFTTLGAIGLQGIRLAEPKIGETAAVIGLGLLGQLTVQMLKANGCAVLGFDIQPARAELARKLGADAVAAGQEEFMALCARFSGGHGVDAVLITADTKSNEPVELAGQVARERGVIVAVGAVGMSIPRKIYYEKELDFRISRSYGPGRYDLAYEEGGHDYPYGYVRWTEGRNMAAFLELIARGAVDVAALTSHRFEIDRAPEAYDLITGKRAEPFLGVLLTYPGEPDMRRKIGFSRDAATPPQPVGSVRLGVIGAGNFANATLLPAIRGLKGIDLAAISSSGGLSARTAATRFGFDYCTTDSTEILRDESINTVAILTRHNQHAAQVVAALEAGKNVFVEKPLCLNAEELEAVIHCYRAKPRPPALLVGFNRRFAPFVVELKKRLLRVQEPLMFHYRVNAGYIPPDHWTQDPQVGGGRLLGEGCHFIDLLIHLAGMAPARITTRALPDGGRYSCDNLVVMIEFENGSIGTLAYLANGDRACGKEFLEVSGGGLSARLEDYRSLSIFQGGRRFKQTAPLRQDKGHRGEWLAFAAHLEGKAPAPIGFEELVLSTRATFAARESLLAGKPVELGGALTAAAMAAADVNRRMEMALE